MQGVGGQPGVDAIDLLLVHAPFGGTDGRLSMWKALVQCQEQGLARSIGVCNYGIAHLERLRPPASRRPR